MKNPFQRWNGKIALKAMVFQGQVKVDFEVDGKITLQEFQASLMMMVVQIGRKLEDMLAQQEAAVRREQLDKVRLIEHVENRVTQEKPVEAEVIDLKPEDKPKWGGS
jgi:iron-sulfur cluster repair protein YtfE (RIC family)